MWDKYEQRIQALEAQIRELKRVSLPFSDPLGRSVRTQLQPRRRVFGKITDAVTYTFISGQTQIWYSWRQVIETYPQFDTTSGALIERSFIQDQDDLLSGQLNAIELEDNTLEFGDIVELIESPWDTGIWYILKSISTNPNAIIAGWEVNNVTGDFVSTVFPYVVTILNRSTEYIKFTGRWLAQNGAGGIKLRSPDVSFYPMRLHATGRLYDTTGGFNAPVLSWAGWLQAPFPIGGVENHIAQSTAISGFFEVEYFITTSVGTGLDSMTLDFAPINPVGNVVLSGSSAFRTLGVEFLTHPP